MEGSVEFIGLKSFAKEIKRMQKASGNLRPAFKRAAVLYQQWVWKNFQRDGGLHNNASLKWKPLKKPSSRRGGISSKILRDTGRLQRDWEFSAGNNWASVKSGVFYSSFHENGTGKIPQRKIFPESKQAEEIIAPAFNMHLFKGKDKI